MSKVLTNGIIIPDNGSRNWGGDLANNWNILDVHVGYMTDVKNKVTTLENSVAENTANIQTNTSNISALQTSKQDAIEDLETIRAGASAGATAVQPSVLSDYVDLSSEQTISGTKTFSSNIVGNLVGNADTATSAENGVDSYGDGWIRFKNGTQICWGTYVSQTQQTSVTFGKAFLGLVSYGAGVCPSDDVNCWISERTATGIVLSTETGDGVFRRVDWLAVGNWK